MTEQLKPGKLLKKHMIDHVAGRLKGANNVFVTDCGSLNNKQIQDLRTKLRQASSNYVVVKNTLCLKAMERIKLKGIEDLITGTCGITYDSMDPVLTSKVLVDFLKENEKFQVKGGCIDGQVVSTSAIKEIASIPPREVLIARLIGSINSPISGIVGTLSGILRKFVYALNAIKDKKQG